MHMINVTSLGSIRNINFLLFLIIYQVKRVPVKFTALGYFNWDIPDWIDIELNRESNRTL